MNGKICHSMIDYVIMMYFPRITSLQSCIYLQRKPDYSNNNRALLSIILIPSFLAKYIFEALLKPFK